MSLKTDEIAMRDYFQDAKNLVASAESREKLGGSTKSWLGKVFAKFGIKILDPVTRNILINEIAALMRQLDSQSLNSDQLFRCIQEQGAIVKYLRTHYGDEMAMNRLPPNFDDLVIAVIERERRGKVVSINSILNEGTEPLQ